MMDIQKAIKYFDGYGSPYDDMVIQALEKQIPKKPESKKLGKSINEYYHCPSCGRIYWRKNHISAYCGMCGQRLDWECEP